MMFVMATTSTTAAPPRFRTVTGAGTIVALILVLAFGNSAYRDWVNKSTSANDAGGFFLRQLTWPAWSFSSNEPLRNLLAADLKALLLIVFTALFLSLLAVSPCYTLPPIAPQNMTEDVAHTFRIITPLGGRQTRYFRFPGLCYDDIALKALAPLGVTVIQGDVVSGDPYATAAAPIIHAVLTRVQPGSIVIMHITEANAQYTDEALSAILSGLRARGLRPVALSELFR